MSDVNERIEWFEEPEDAESFTLSQKGLDTILEWCRFKCQLAEMEHGEAFEAGELDYDTEVAFLVAFAITELRGYRQVIAEYERGDDA
jgi:hypothetical protein